MSRTAFALVVGIAMSIGSARAALPERISPPMADTLFEPLPGDIALFLDGFDKTRFRSFDDIARYALRYYHRWRPALRREGLTDREAEAVSFMLFTSTLWAYGNAHRPQQVGCIPANEVNHWKFESPTLTVVKRASIGCCSDYAYMLSLILSKAGFENRYDLIPGHIFNEAKIDGRWRVLDANTNIFIDTSWNEALSGPRRPQIYIFSHPGALPGKLHRARIDSFQNDVANGVRLHLAQSAVNKPGRPPDRAHAHAIEELY